MAVELDVARATTVASTLEWTALGLDEFDRVVARVATTLDVTQVAGPVHAALHDVTSGLTATATVLRTRCEMATAADQLTLRHHQHLETRLADSAAVAVSHASRQRVTTAVGTLADDLRHAASTIAHTLVSHRPPPPINPAVGGACPASGPDAIGACMDWALAEVWGVSPRFLHEVAAPLATGHLPTWKPEWIEETRDWQPAELELMTTLFTEWHDTHGLTPHPDTWHAYTNFRDTPDDIPDHLAGGEFFPFISDTFALDLATALLPVGLKVPGPLPAIAGRARHATFGETLLDHKWFGIESRLFGHESIRQTPGVLNAPGRLLKAGWSSSDFRGGGLQFRLGVGRRPSNPNHARLHPTLRPSHVPNHVGMPMLRAMQAMR